MQFSPARSLRRCADLALIALLVAVGTGAACSDDTKEASRSEAMSLTNDSAAGGGAVNPAVESAVLAYRVDTPITEVGFERWSAASADLARMPDSSIAFVRRLDGAAAGESRSNPIDAAVARLDGDPAAREIIARHGLTPRDYVLTTIALYQAQVATERAPEFGAYQPPPANVAFVRARPEAARAARQYWEDDARVVNGLRTSGDRRSDRGVSGAAREGRVGDAKVSDRRSDGRKSDKKKSDKKKSDKKKSDK